MSDSVQLPTREYILFENNITSDYKEMILKKNNKKIIITILEYYQTVLDLYENDIYKKIYRINVNKKIINEYKNN
jgi:hypothetical protein